MLAHSSMFHGDNSVVKQERVFFGNYASRCKAGGKNLQLGGAGQEIPLQAQADRRSQDANSASPVGGNVPPIPVAPRTSGSEAAQDSAAYRGVVYKESIVVDEDRSGSSAQRLMDL